MKDLQPKTMTILELSKKLEVSRDLIEKRIKEQWPDKMKKGVATRLNEYEVTAVKMRIQENTLLATSDNRRKLVDMPKTNLEKELLIHQAMILQAEKVNNLQLELQHERAENKQLQIQLDESKQYHSVKKIKNLGLLSDIPARKMWGPLKRWSIENDYQIISIFDANYGEVKTYHADAWEAVYGVQL